MSQLTLKDAASFLRTGRTVPGLRTFMALIRRIFTFTQERANRLTRFLVIVKAYKRGMPVRDIEEQYGCSKQTVLRYARLAGLPRRDRGFDPTVRRAVIAAYKLGKPIAEIQARFGVSQAYISKTATEEGINRRVFSKSRAQR